MKLATKYQSKTPEEIVCQYRCNFHIKQGLIILVFLLYSVGSVWMIWWNHGRFLDVLLLVLIFLITTFSINTWISWDFISLNAIMNQNCDPVTYVQVMRLLGEKRNHKRIARAIQINEAFGLMWAGHFSEALSLAESLFKSESNTANQLNLLHVRFHCSMKLENQESALQIQQEAKTLVSAITKPALQKRGKEVLNIMADGIAMRQGDYEKFCREEEARIANYRANIQYVSSALNLAKADLAHGESQNARSRLEYVIQAGGTLYAVVEAGQLLAELEGHK